LVACQFGTYGLIAIQAFHSTLLLVYELSKQRSSASRILPLARPTITTEKSDCIAASQCETSGVSRAWSSDCQHNYLIALFILMIHPFRHDLFSSLKRTVAEDKLLGCIRCTKIYKYSLPMIIASTDTVQLDLTDLP
jgi:hypothetical protein